jgi:cell division protein FtsL
MARQTDVTKQRRILQVRGNILTTRAAIAEKKQQLQKLKIEHQALRGAKTPTR